MGAYTNTLPQATPAENLIQHSAVFTKPSKISKKNKQDEQFMLIPRPPILEDYAEQNEQNRAAHLLQEIIHQGRLANENNKGTPDIYFSEKARIETLMQRFNLILDEPTLVAGFTLSDIACRQKTLNQRTVYIDPDVICAENLTKLYLPLELITPSSWLQEKESVPQPLTPWDLKK